MGDVILDLSILENADLLQKLVRLAKCIREDPVTGDLILQKANARIVLKESGDIRIEGRNIISVADEKIALNGAYIDLN